MSNALGVNTVAELKAKAQSGAALNYATLGDGSFPDLFLRWLNNQWNTKIVGIPYRGGGPAAQALAANDVQVTRFGVGNFTGLLEARQGEGAGGRPAQALAASSRRSDARRRPACRGFPGQGWWGLAAPKGTPPAVVERLNAEFVKLFSEPKFVAFLDKQSVVSAPTSPDGFAAFLKEDRKAAETLITIANTKPEEYKPEK